VTILVTVYVCDRVYSDVSSPKMTGRILFLIMVSTVLNDSVTVFKGGVA